MAGFSSALNPNVVKTALDKVFFQEFDGSKKPELATAETASIFKQDSVSNSAVIEEVFQGTGLWGTRSEEQDVPQATPKVGNKITFLVSNYAQSVDISKNFFDDNMHGVYQRMVRDMATTGRITRDNTAFGLFRNAFTTTLTADGIALISAAHLTLNGTTVSNSVSGALTEANLNTAIVSLMEQKAQDGTIRGNVPSCLLVPPQLFKTACEIVDSELRSGTANNDINVYSSKYGIYIYTSPYLGAAAGGSDTAWFLLGNTHASYRWVRQGVVTALVDWRTQRNNNYIYKGEYREMVGAVDYAGIVGSTGL